MQCPVDKTPLVMTDRQGIEIDYCPECRGVWLDRGELDKIVERGSAYESAPRPEASRSYDQAEHRDARPYREEHRDDRHDGYRGDHHDGRKKHKREGFLGDLFDFGD